MNTARHIVRKLFGQPDFVLTVAILGVSALGLNVCTDYLKLHYRKQAVQMRVSALDGTDGIPGRMGKWIQIDVDPPLKPEVEEILGTSKYVFRQYANSEVIGPARIASIRAMDGTRGPNDSASPRDKAIAELADQFPQAVLHVSVTYYTGMVDTVAHIPDRCFLADGFEVTHYDTRKDRTLGAYADGSPRKLDYRLINFEDESGRGRAPKNVAYFFHVNGHYEPDPLGVRRSLQNLFETFGYYAKVEVMAPGELPRPGETSEQARQRSTDAIENLLTSLLPEVERCLPDWGALHARAAK
jgi:hypothetical protein